MLHLTHVSNLRADANAPTPLRRLLKGVYIAAYSTSPEAKVSTKNHYTTMKIKVPEAEILRTPIKIEKLSLWNRTGSGFIMNLEFHGFQRRNKF